MKKLMESFDMSTLGRRRRSTNHNKETTNHNKEEQEPIRSQKEDNHNRTTTTATSVSNLRRISKIFEWKRKTPPDNVVTVEAAPKIEVKQEEERKTNLRRIKSCKSGGGLPTEFGSLKKYKKHGKSETQENVNNEKLQEQHGADSSWRRSAHIITTRRRTHARCNLRPTPPLVSFFHPPPPCDPGRFRHRIIQELIDSELTYLENLHDIVEGFLMKCRQRRQMFEARQIEHLFGNIEQIYKFQKQFLSELHASISDETNENIGQVFLRNENNFSTIYSIYCNNHPRSSEVYRMLLCDDDKYSEFLEICRIHQHMIDIPLDGFLLTPVQKICKYPLQLAEVLKHTAEDSPDYRSLHLAFVSMTNVTSQINEEKRRMENLCRLQRWQAHVIGWKGEDIYVGSNFHIFSGEVLVCAGRKSKSRIAYLFDRQLVICKKEVLARDVVRFVSRHETSAIRSILIHNVPIELRLKERVVQTKWWKISSDLFMLCENAGDQINWESHFNIEKKILSENDGINKKLVSGLDNPVYLGFGEQVHKRCRKEDLRHSTSTSALTTARAKEKSISKKFASLRIRRSHKSKSHHVF